MTKISLKEFKKYQQEGYTIIDVRDTQDFSIGFIPGSINILFDRDFKETAKQLLIKNQPMLLISKVDEEDKLLKQIKDFGYSEMLGYLEGGIDTWINANEQMDIVISISTEEFGLELKHGDLYQIDLRPEEEFDIQHVDKAFNFDPEVLINNYDALDDSITNCIYCLDGKYSMTIISYLKFHGKYNLYHVHGGFNEIKKESNIKLVATEKKFESKEGEQPSIKN